MHRVNRWLLWSLGGLSAFLLFASTILMLAANNQSGRIWIERAVSKVSNERVVLSGLDGNFPRQFAVKHIELRDSSGAWLTMDELAINWLPMKLLAGEVEINQLQARYIEVARLPVLTDETGKATEPAVPLVIDLHSLQVEHFEAAPSLAGRDANFVIDGRLRLVSSDQGEMELRIRQLEGKAVYAFQGKLSGDDLHVQVSLHEASDGPLVTLANIDNHEGLNLDASLEGPLSAVRGRATLKLDDLQMLLDGTIDFSQDSADIVVAVNAPAMQLRPDLAWRKLALNLQLQGPLLNLDANGDIRIDGLSVAQAAIGGLAVKFQGKDGRIGLDGELARLSLAASQTDLLNAVPLSFQATLGLDKPSHPISFELKHSLLTASGQARWRENEANAAMALTLPDLRSVTALAGFPIAGNSRLTLSVNRHDDSSRWEIAGMLDSHDESRLAKLLGKTAKFDLSLITRGDDVFLSGLRLDGEAIMVSADGEWVAGKSNFNWQSQLKDIKAFVPTISGRLAAQGHLSGTLDSMTLAADLEGELAGKGYASGPINATLRLQNMPHASSGHLNIGGMLNGAPAIARMTIDAFGNQSIQIGLDKADWKSCHAKGRLIVSMDGSLPVGKIDWQIARLDDLRPLLGLPVTGSLNATLETAIQGGRPAAKLKLDARHAGLTGTATVERSNLALVVNEPLGRSRLDGLLNLEGISAGDIHGSAKIKLAGFMDAIRLGLSANMPNLSGSEVELSGAAQLNLGAGLLAINSLQATWQKQIVRLLKPAKLVFTEGLAVDRLRFGLRRAELELKGRFSPELAVTAELDDGSADLLSLFAPNLAMAGSLHANADLRGSLDKPTGLIRFHADKLQMQQGSGRALPPVRGDATALLHGDAADLNVALEAGSDSRFKIAGQFPLTHAGLFDLHGEGRLELKQLDPILNAEGRHARGRLTVNGKVGGSWSSPSVTGSAQLNQGEWQDYAMGLEISDIIATLNAENGTISLQGRAGPGTLTATGSIGILSESIPIDLTIVARNARPITSDRLTVDLDADVLLRGLAAEQLTAAGRIHINRAEIRIPERMPTSIAVLKMSDASTPLPPSEANNNIALNLTIDAPREIYLRGRGMDAELGGNVHVVGTAKKLRPDGNFKLRRGQFMLVGQTLIFSQGSVGFDNGSLTNPSLNFVANTSRDNITASFSVAGSAQHPKIILSSSPELPQDEILANLLFGHGTSTLSPLEMVQIASALASLSGVNAGMDDPLESARKRLGLDRLSVGGANPSVEGGRYIAPGVYLGAKQGISGGKPQATIQIDVTKRLKLEGNVGSGATSSGTSTTNSVGVIYQFEY